MRSKDKQLIVISGPTAVGKTSLTIELAQSLRTEIISCDSRQIYREMTIGTAKPTREELNTVPHHFINSHSIHDTFTVADYMHAARSKISELFEHHDRLIMTGGTGLYIDAVIHGLHDFPTVAPEINAALEQRLEESGLQSLQEQLKSLDPLYYEQIDQQNSRRIIRALGVCISSKKPFSYFLNKAKIGLNYPVQFIVLNRDRQELYERINMRVDLMMRKDWKQKHAHYFRIKHYVRFKRLAIKNYSIILNII